MQGRGPVLVINAQTKRETGRKVQLANVQAAKTVAELVRTCLGPKAMMKMILASIGGVVITNDGNAILREVDVAHPAAKTMIELSKNQDDEVGDGTTSVTILAGEILAMAEPWLEKNMHPRTIITAYTKALDDAVAHLKAIAVPIDLANRAELLSVVKRCLGTKFTSQFYPPFLSDIALDAVSMIVNDLEGRREVDIKRFVRVEKIPGGNIEDCKLVSGVVFEKDVTHSGMARRIEKPRIVLLDCNLEYKKGDNQFDVAIEKPEDLEELMRQEEVYVKGMCDAIIKVKPNLVMVEKGVSDLAQHYLVKAGITCLRRLKKTDSDRLARACGATIINRPEELQDSHVGTRATLFEIKKIGDEYYTFVECDSSKACTIVLRGATKDILNEIERNLQDALAVARNIYMEPLLLPGGGATEMSVATKLTEKAKTIAGVEQYPYQGVALALEVIPRTLIQNAGTNVVKTITALRAKHAAGEGSTWGIDGERGTVRDMKEYGLWEPFSVKAQTLKTALEAACMLLKVDDVVSGLSKTKGAQPNPGGVNPSQATSDDMQM